MSVKTKTNLVLALFVAAALAAAPAAASAREEAALSVPPPTVDYHFHLLSPAGAELLNKEEGAGADYRAITADDAIAKLDAAGIHTAVILSDAYFYDSQEAAGFVADPRKALMAENDWTASQVRGHADRLVAFCGINPLADYAIEELRRCGRDRTFRGLKLHFDTSGVDLLNPAHIAKVRAVFAEADRLRYPIIIHVGTAMKPSYGRPHAHALVSELAPAAPHVPIIIAHLWGGANYTDEAMDEYAKAVAGGANLFFEISHGANFTPLEARQAMADRMRQIGVKRFLFGTDFPILEGVRYEDAWTYFRNRIPLTEPENAAIAANVLPFARTATPRR